MLCPRAPVVALPQQSARLVSSGERSREPVRFCAKASAGQEMSFEQNNPHPDPPDRRERERPDPSLAASKAAGYADRQRTIFPPSPDASNGKGPPCLPAGSGSGECAPTPEVVFARVLICDAETRVDALFVRRFFNLFFE